VTALVVAKTLKRVRAEKQRRGVACDSDDLFFVRDPMLNTEPRFSLRPPPAVEVPQSYFVTEYQE